MSVYDETLDLRLLKSWVAAYKTIEKRDFEVEMPVGWYAEANALRRALFVSRDPDNQLILDKLWESVIV